VTEKAEQKILRVGVIGLGDIWQSHAQAYPDNLNAVVVGFYDRIRGRAETWKDKMMRYMHLVRKAAEEKLDPEDEIHLQRCTIFDKEAKVYDSIQDMLNHVDVIDICAPNHVHASYAIWALKKGKSVMSEKPAGRCSYETEHLCRVAASSTGFYQLNENFLWYSSLRKLREIVTSKKIGKINKINIRLGHGHPSWGWQNHFLNPSLSGGGVLSDMGVHAIGFGYGILGPNYKVQSVQTIRMNAGTTKERTLHQFDGANEYYLSSFMVEDEAKIKVIFRPDPINNSLIEKTVTDSNAFSEADLANESKSQTNEITNPEGEMQRTELEAKAKTIANGEKKELKKIEELEEISVIIEVSWAKSYRDITIHGSLGTCGLDRNSKKQEIVAIYYENGQQEEISISNQARDSHQLEIIDFLNRIQAKRQSLLEPTWAHRFQEIISCAYLSHLRGFEMNSKKGMIVTLDDLRKYYREIENSGVPKEMIIEEIVYDFMRPFTSSYYSVEEHSPQ